MDKLKIFDSLYDAVRIVDPSSKKVLILSGEEIIVTDHTCYAFWNKDSLCDNCISIRAFHENKSLIKIEKKGKEIIMVTAIPIKLNGDAVVVELLKDVTDSILLSKDVAVENKEINDVISSLNDMVSKDGLTNIYNRRYVDERLPVDIIKILENRMPVSVIMADIDFFKNVNDTFGHIAGDQVLKAFAIVLKISIRESRDWVARFGGEEFLICLPGANKETGLKTAERIRSLVENMNVPYNENIIKITSSFGVATIDEDTMDKNSDYKYNMLLEEADKNLYEAKRTGRNKVI